MSLIVHHLNNSRSQRILWLLEEIGAPYEIKFYDRDQTTNLAPPELLAVHPLGKSPLIEELDDSAADGRGRVIIESGAITEYLCERHGGAHLVPERGSDDHVSHLEWLHFAEGSAMTPILLRIYTARLGEAAAPLEPRIAQQLDAHFAFMESRVGDNGHFIGDSLSAADIMLSFPAEIAVMQGVAPRYPKLAAFVNACHVRPAWQRAREKGGAYYGY
ncbi:glutathione S-transferase [Sphingopyxis panaciterrae]|uniref:glutathione S-transferase family protein n=1 Tax=Sphingopyxis panaciterrae TaxID=363841 RepID=UPI0014241FE2|nr:glutathione S-transferase family protein [Sphingopyxis panaciterrae]NIJ36163.1 glutathione S-transferase [Sphingopyxis panaciterrae]